MKTILSFLIISALWLSGCSSAHRKITEKTAVLGKPFVSCNINNECEIVRNWEVPGRKPGTTSQLTPAGCALHTLVTGGHIAWECRNEKATRGKWLWHRRKRS